MASSGTQPQPKAPILNAASSEDQMKRVCRCGVEAFNVMDFEFQTPAGQEYRSHIAPHFSAQFDAHGRTLTFTELINAFREWYEKHPGFQCQYKHMTAHVDEAAGTGMVHFELELVYEATYQETLEQRSSGHKAASEVTHIKQEALGELKFKMDASGKWMAEHYIGMRGIPGMGGYV